MMHPNPERRITFEGIRRHRWFKRANELMTQKGKCNDPVNLAEKLLQGLAVSGDINLDVNSAAAAAARRLDLHTDGQRAQVPENVSLTQPEAIQNSSFGLAAGSTVARGWRDDAGHGGGLALPSSTAMPAMTTSNDDMSRRLAMSQHISTRRLEFSSSGSGLGSDTALPGASQFTQALNHFTQFQALTHMAGAGSSHLRFSPHLTRFFSSATAAAMVGLITEVLDGLAIQNVADAIGDQEELEEAYNFMVDGEPETSSAGDDASRTASKRIAIGSRGARVRLATMDKRKCPLRGEVRVENLVALDSASDSASTSEDAAKCLVVMKRSKGDPLEWRRLFREVCRKAEIQATIIST